MARRPPRPIDRAPPLGLGAALRPNLYDVALFLLIAAAFAVLADYYAGETFVPVRPLSDRKWLERDRFLRADRLIDTNSMELAVYGNEAEEQILAVASLDNLGKGASGAAVQVINLKTGVDETTGLAVAA